MPTPIATYVGMKRFGPKMEAIRNARGLSQDALAGLVGCSQSVIGNWEKGKSKPNVENATKIADALGVDLDYLVRDERENPLPPPEEVMAVKIVRALEIDETEVIRRLNPQKLPIHPSAPFPRRLTLLEDRPAETQAPGQSKEKKTDHS